MATLAVAAAATVAANIGSILVSTALSVGVGLAQRALTPDTKTSREGARLGNTNLVTSTEGSPIPRVLGKWRISGELIWSSRFIERVTKTTESSGGKGGPKQTSETTEYTYYANFAIALCEGSDTMDIGKIWVDGSRVKPSKIDFRFYQGTETQMPDPLIESVEGAGKVPAFRGICYIVFENLPITPYGNRIPQVAVEVIERGTLNLSTALKHFKSDLSMDTTAIPDISVQGVLVADITSNAAVIHNICDTFLLDPVEENGTIVVRPRSLSPNVTIYLDEMVSQDGETYVRTRKYDTDLPDRTTVGFTDPRRAYQDASVDGHMVTGLSRNVDTFSTIVASDTGYCRELADIMTQESWIARDGLEFAVALDRHDVRPMATFDIELRGVPYTFRVQDITIGDQIDVTAIGFNPRIYATSVYPDSDELVYAPIDSAPIATVFADMPLKAEDAPNRWSPRLVSYATPWPIGANVFRADGSGGYAFNTQVTAPSVTMTTTTDLQSGKVWVWDDECTVTVALDNPVDLLSGASDLSVLNGANRLAIMTPSGQYEILQFTNATLNGDGTYTLSRLLRGQLGTEAYMGDPTPAGAFAFLVDEGRQGYLEGSSELIGIESTYRTGPIGVDLDDPFYSDTTISHTGVALRPFAPVHLKTTKLPSGNFRFDWTRRTRIGGDNWAQDDVPLNEETERYGVRVIGGSGYTVFDTTTLTYTVADQVADFGSEQTSVDWQVWQFSNAYGQGTRADGSY